MRTGEFVVDGFEVPEAKTQISWEDENTVLIGTDFGRGLADRLRVSAAGQALASGHTARRCRDLVQRVEHRRHRRGVEGPHTRLRADVAESRRRLLQRRGLRAARRRAHPHRRAHRRDRVHSSQLAADRAAHRLVHRDRLVRRGIADRRRLRRIPLRHSRSARRLRARRPHQPQPLRVDEGQAGHRHARRCRQPRRDGDPRHLGNRAGAGHSGQHQRGHRRHRRPRRRDLPGLQRIHHAVAAAATDPSRARSRRSSRRRRSSTPKTSP